MAIFKKWLASIGINRARLTVEVASDTCCRGGVISGTVRLYGGGVRQRIEHIGVDFAKSFGEGGLTKYTSLVVATQITVEPRALHIFAYTLQVPHQVPISYRGSLKTYQYLVMLDSWRSRGGLWYKSVSITVLPEAEILVLDEALQLLGFLPDKSNFFAPSSPVARSTFVKQTYSVPDAVQAQGTHMTLHVGVVDDHIQGHLLLSQGLMRNLTDLMVYRAGHQQRLAIDMPRAVLLGEHGRAQAVSMFQKLLSGALMLPHSPQHWLLRGTNKPPERQETLLRPAHGVGAEEQETLLRPVQENDP